MPENRSAWAKAEILARRIYELTTVPMRSENHPTWDPKWRLAMTQGLAAIGTGDEQTMERALMEIERLAKTLGRHQICREQRGLSGHPLSTSEPERSALALREQLNPGRCNGGRPG
jgi:hypothetical protein